MKRLTSFLTVLTVLASLAMPVLAAMAASTNLIANPSVEAAASGQPDNWTANKWGANTTTLSYENTAHTGSKSLLVNMTARTDGDAKWQAAPVTVEANKSYTYTSWYKASVDTEIDLQYTDAAGAVSYAYVQSVPASSEWKQLTTAFTTPANANKVSVLHIVASVGSLQTDDFSLGLTEATPPITPPVEPPAGTNLIANPSFETAAGTLPASWDKNSWGTNTNSFTYASTGHTGTRSAKVAISAFTNGDAKWFATPVAVTPGQAYTYTDWYSSAVSTRVVVASINASGAYAYQELAAAPASTTWKQYTTNFTTPADAAKVTLYHLIDKVGSLNIDDVSLAKASTTTPPTTPPTTPTEIIPNASAETASAANANLPDKWASSAWGTNTPTFAYVAGGHNSNKSLKVTMSGYTDGDAKWYFNPLETNSTTLQKGKQYRLTSWYKAKAGVVPKAVAMFERADGSAQYFGMPNPQPAADSATVWQKYSDTFSIPTDAVRVSVFFYINQNGWIQTDDYSLTPYAPTGFSSPLLSLTFDDGHEDNVTNALPVLNQYGFKSTQCFATEFIENDPAQATTNVKAFYNSGHEICSHTVSHPMLTSLTATNLNYELQHSQQYLKSITGAPVKNFASPYGDYNASVNTAIKKYYRSHRTVDEGYNSKDNFNIYRIRVQNILSTTSAAQVSAWVQQAQIDKTWLVLVYHRVGTDPGPFDSSTQDFKDQMAAIKQSGITVKTYDAALDTVTAQL